MRRKYSTHGSVIVDRKPIEVHMA